MQILNGFLLSHIDCSLCIPKVSHIPSQENGLLHQKLRVVLQKKYIRWRRSVLFINSNQNNRLGTSGICFLHFRSQHCVLKSYLIHSPNHFSAEITKYGKKESIGTNLQQSTSSCFEFIHFFPSVLKKILIKGDVYLFHLSAYLVLFYGK